MLTEEDVRKAADLLWQETPDRAKGFRPIKSGFEEGLISADLARSVTNALLRVAMYDYGQNGWRVTVHEILRKVFSPNQNDDVVVAITETLIAIPEEHELIDYAEAASVLNALFQAERIHPALTRTVQLNVTKIHNETTDICVIQSIRSYLSSTQYKLVSEEVYSVLMAMLEEGSDYACSEGIKTLISIIDKNRTIQLNIDDLEFLWNRANADMLNTSRAHVDDTARNSAKLIALFVSRSKEPLTSLPYPLNELSPQLNNRYVSYIRSELKEREMQAVSEVGWGSPEYSFALMQVEETVNSYLASLSK